MSVEIERRAWRPKTRTDELIEAAYWEMEARVDPTQTQYPTSGRHYAFVKAVENMLRQHHQSPWVSCESCGHPAMNCVC